MSTRNRPEAKAARRTRRAYRAAAAESERTGVPVVVPELLEAAAGYSPDVPRHGEPGPRTAAIIERFRAQFRTGTARPCPHLKAGMQAHWLAWTPGRLLCAACFLAAAQRAVGTREVRTCDSCRREAAPEESSPRASYVAYDDVTLFFGLCPECFTADQAGSEA